MPNILVVDDEKLIRWSIEKHLEKKWGPVATAASFKEALQRLNAGMPDVALLDIRLPDGEGTDLLLEIRKRDPFTAVIMITANDQISTAVECMKAGAFHYLHKPFNFDELDVLIEKALETRQLRQRISYFESQEKEKYVFDKIIGQGKAMGAVKDLIKQVAVSEAETILLQGESGVGKDLVANTLHYGSRRMHKPILTLNCAAIPANLLESELFGHEKGAFTDASQAKKGLVEEATEGALFLDEIGDMALEMQAKLLHLIENKSYRRVGSVVEKKTNLRIIAATNKNLKKEVAAGRFREDLYYRLNVIPILLPPLRERKEDIPELVSAFIAAFNQAFRKNVTEMAPEALEILQMYDWPGNVRELRNVIERAMILNQEPIIRRQHIPAEIDCRCEMIAGRGREDEESTAKSILPQCLAGVPLEALEKHALVLAMQKSGGNQSTAAAMLGIGRDALRYKLQKYDLLTSNEQEIA